jgi:regulatory protein
VVRDKNLPTPDRQKARRGTARGGASARKRGAARLTVVEDPGDGLGSGISGGELPGGGSSYDGSLRGESPGGRGTDGTESSNAKPGGPESGGEEAARLICLRLLTSGPRTRAQLATALRKRRIPDEVADSVLGRFAEVGLIDDAAFARAWVESRHHGRGLARKALAAELRQRGVADGEVRSAVGLLGPQDELATAQRLVARRVAASRGKPMPVRARQLMGMLARKGYPAGLAAQVVREALEQDQADGGGSTDLAWISEDGSGDAWS